MHVGWWEFMDSEIHPSLMTQSWVPSLAPLRTTTDRGVIYSSDTSSDHNGRCIRASKPPSGMNYCKPNDRWRLLFLLVKWLGRIITVVVVVVVVWLCVDRSLFGWLSSGFWIKRGVGCEADGQKSRWFMIDDLLDLPFGRRSYGIGGADSLE